MSASWQALHGTLVGVAGLGRLGALERGRLAVRLLPHGRGQGQRRPSVAAGLRAGDGRPNRLGCTFSTGLCRTCLQPVSRLA